MSKDIDEVELPTETILERVWLDGAPLAGGAYLGKKTMRVSEAAHLIAQREQAAYERGRQDSYLSVENYMHATPGDEQEFAVQSWKEVMAMLRIRLEQPHNPGDTNHE